MLYTFINNIVFSYITLILGFTPFLSYSSGPILGEDNCQMGSLPISEEKSDPEIISEPPNINSPSAAVLATDVNFWLFEKSALELRSIASITKLMTALVFLDTSLDFNSEYTIISEDIVSGGRIHLFLGDTLTIEELFYTTLISSDNGAATALVRSTGLSQAEFIDKMNNKARDLALFSTKFTDVTGLSNGNISTAKDVARLAKEALNQELIKKALQKKEYRFITREGREKIIISTANGLLENNENEFFLSLGKTGYTDQAGFCFVGRYLDDNGKEVISVVLGADSRQSRFIEANLLANWAFNNCDW